MLNKFSAAAKLYMLLFITAASLIGLGVYGIDDLEKMNENTKSLYADRVLPFQQLSNIRFAYTAEVIHIAEKVKDHRLGFNEAKKRLRESENIINKNWHDYKLTYLTPEEALLVKQTDIIKNQADEANKELEAILAREDIHGLDGLIQNKFSADPAPFTAKLTQLMQLQVRVGKEIFNNNNEIYRVTSTKSLWLIFFSLAIAVSLSLLIIKNIRKLIRDILLNNHTIKESEDKYHSLFEQASDAIFVLNDNGDFTNVNKSMCDLVGYTCDELLTMQISDLLNAELIKANPLLYAAAKPGDIALGERKVIHKNGTIIDIEINAKKFVDRRVLVIARDITERKAMEAELRISEQKYKMLFDSSPMALLMVAKNDLSIIAANKEATTLYGYTNEELLKMIIKDLRHEEDRAEVWDNFKLDLDASSDRGIFRHLKKDGTIIFVQVIAHDIIFEGKHVRLGLYNDLTEKLKAEQEHQKTEANLQTILNTTDTAYALLDRNLDVLEYNEKALTFAKNEFNFDPHSGGKLFDHLPESRRLQFFQYIDDVLKGETISYEVSYPQHEEMNIWYYVRMFPISSKENEILGLVLAITDITERKDAEQSLQSAYDRIKENIQLIREMVWKQSHILRSPVANLKGLTTMLQNDPADGQVLSYIKIELERMDAVFLEMAKDSSKDEMIY